MPNISDAGKNIFADPSMCAFSFGAVPIAFFLLFTHDSVDTSERR